MRTYKISKDVYPDYVAWSPVPGEKLKSFYSNSVRNVDDLDSIKAKKLYDICSKICKFLDDCKLQYRISPLGAGVSFHYINDELVNKPFMVKTKKYTMNILQDIAIEEFKYGVYLYTVAIDESCNTNEFTVNNDEFKLRAAAIRYDNLLDEFPRFEFI